MTGTVLRSPSYSSFIEINIIKLFEKPQFLTFNPTKKKRNPPTAITLSTVIEILDTEFLQNLQYSLRYFLSRWTNLLARWSSTLCCASVRNTRGACAGGVPGGDTSDATPADDERPYGMGGLPGAGEMIINFCTSKLILLHTYFSGSGAWSIL